MRRILIAVLRKISNTSFRLSQLAGNRADTLEGSSVIPAPSAAENPLDYADQNYQPFIPITVEETMPGS